jgi:hypothetical protein
MRRFLVSLVALSFVAAGCNSDSKPKNQKSGSTGPAWSLTLQAEDYGSGPAHTVAFHGFTVDADGGWAAGPTSDGQIARGQVSAEELAAVEAALSPVLEVAFEKQPDHAGSPSGYYNHRITLFRQGESRVISNVDGFTQDYIASDLEDVDVLRGTLYSIANTHYPTPFPETPDSN